jgi:hypothetical protein
LPPLIETKSIPRSVVACSWRFKTDADTTGSALVRREREWPWLKTWRTRPTAVLVQSLDQNPGSSYEINNLLERLAVESVARTKHMR